MKYLIENKLYSEKKAIEYVSHLTEPVFVEVIDNDITIDKLMSDDIWEDRRKEVTIYKYYNVVVAVECGNDMLIRTPIYAYHLNLEREYSSDIKTWIKELREKKQEIQKITINSVKELADLYFPDLILTVYDVISNF